MWHKYYKQQGHQDATILILLLTECISYDEENICGYVEEFISSEELLQTFSHVAICQHVDDWFIRNGVSKKQNFQKMNNRLWSILQHHSNAKRLERLLRNGNINLDPLSGVDTREPCNGFSTPLSELSNLYGYVYSRYLNKHTGKHSFLGLCWWGQYIVVHPFEMILIYLLYELAARLRIREVIFPIFQILVV